MLEGKIIYPCHRNVLVRMDVREEKKGAIYLPEQSQRANEWGTVQAKGGEVVNVDEEDRVFVPRIDGTHFIVADVEYLMVDERKILLKQAANINPMP